MPWIPIAAAGASLVGGVVKDVIDSNNTANANRANRDFAQAQQDKQNAYNLDMWNRTNAYNTPAATMARFKAAGLNPNLVAGNVGGGLAPLPHPSAGAEYHAQVPQYSDPVHPAIEAYQNAAATMQQIDQSKAVEANIAADIALKAHQQGLLDAQRDVEVAKIPLMGHQGDALVSETARNYADATRTNSMLPLDMAVASGNVSKLAAEVRNIAANTSVVVPLAVAKIGLDSASMQEALQRVSLEVQQTAKTSAEIDQVKALTTDIVNSGVLKSYDIDMRDKGMMPSENPAFRILGALMQSFSRLINPRADKSFTK